MEDTWRCMKEGSKIAFLEIYQQNYAMLFSYGFSVTTDKELTKDCIQEMFLEIWNKRDLLNNDVHNVKSYLFTWLRRKISRTQSAFLKEKKFETDADNGEPNQKSYEELLVIFQDTEEKKENISRALSHLTKNQIRIIKMKFFDNLTYIQIAAETNLTTRTVYNTIYMAIQHLRDDTCLKQYL